MSLAIIAELLKIPPVHLKHFSKPRRWDKILASLAYGTNGVSVPSGPEQAFN